MSDYLEEIYKEVRNCIDFDFTSNSNKPSHVANNLFRCCLGSKSKTSKIHQWMVVSSNVKQKNIKNSEDLLEEYKTIFDPTTTCEDIKALRSMLYEIYNQDNTIYPNENFSCATSSNFFTVKGAVNSEQKVGTFIFNILNKNINGEKSPAIELIKKALLENDDAISRVIIPFCKGIEQETTEEDDDDDFSWDNYKQVIRDSFDCLANNIKKMKLTDNSLLILQRFVSLSIFGALFYFININNIYENIDKPTPILLDLGTNSYSIIRASHECLIMAKKNIENFFVNKIYEILLPYNYQSDNDCLQRIESMPLNDEKVRDTLRRLFKTKLGSEDCVMNFAKAIQETIYTHKFKNCTPIEFIRTCLGMRNGFIGPKGNGAIKRFYPCKFIIENLIFSSVCFEDLEEGIELSEFGKILRSKYNIIFGVNNDSEYKELTEYEIRSNTPGDLLGDLHKNSIAFGDAVISLGLGKKYADGVTMIGWRL